MINETFFNESDFFDQKLKNNDPFLMIKEVLSKLNTDKLLSYSDNIYFISKDNKNLGKILTAIYYILKYKSCPINIKNLIQIKIESKTISNTTISNTTISNKTPSNTKILSWNVNGIRSNVLSTGSLKKCGITKIDPTSNLGDLIKTYDPDILCFQETKCDEKTFGCITIKDYHQYWNCSQGEKARSGSRYSGTSIWSKVKPNTVLYNIPTLPEPDEEGRIVIAIYNTFILINLYSPNSGTNFEYRTKIWDIALKKYLKQLKNQNILVIVCGDLNVSHEEIDVFFSDKSSSRYSKEKVEGVGKKAIAGFTKEERKDFDNILKLGYTDTFRYFHPNERSYTWFNLRIPSDRSNNKGMRLDYFLTSDIKCIKSSNILTKSGLLTKPNGSDHTAILLEMNC